MTDLFNKRSDKDKLLEYFKIKKTLKTHDVIEWGLKNGSNRAERNARQLAEENKIRRLTDEEKAQLFWYLPKMKEDVWVVNPEN